MGQLEMTQSLPLKENYYKNHQDLVRIICLELQKEFPDMLIFQQHVGLFYRRNGSPISIGTKGMSDIYFLLPYKNQLTCGFIEVKTGKSGLSKPQKNFKEQIQKRNGLFVVGRSSQQTLNAVKEYYDAYTK